MGIGLVDGGLAVNHAVVVLGVRHRDAHGRQRGAVGDRSDERNDAHRVGDLDLARDHGTGHVDAGLELEPPELDAHLLVVPPFGLGHLVGGRPFREVGDGDRLGLLRRRNAEPACHRQGGRQNCPGQSLHRTGLRSGAPVPAPVRARTQGLRRTSCAPESPSPGRASPCRRCCRRTSAIPPGWRGR